MQNQGFPRALKAALAQRWPTGTIDAVSTRFCGACNARLGVGAPAGGDAPAGVLPLLQTPLPPNPWADPPASCRAMSTLHNRVQGFVFDIDGVLVRGSTVLTPARKALQSLCRGGVFISPVVFLTNGGGCTEAKKAAELSGWLDVPVTEEQVILSHTPFKDLAGRLGDEPVLVAGRRDVMEVAEHYGFKRVVTSYDLVAASSSSAVPFGAAALSEAVAARRQRIGCPVLDRGWGTPAAPIRAVLVFNDPQGDAWYQELQLLHDTVTSHGVPLDRHPAPGSRPVEVFFSNPDLLWANDHPRPRFGQGAFASALEALHRATTGRPIPAVRYFGKPHPEPYRLAERLLLRQAKALGLAPSDAVDASSVFSAIFAVGDNPAADVRGANSAGAPWVSVLVRTGVFEGPPGANDPSDPAHLVVDDVAAAVEAAHHRARHAKWHAMR